MKIASSLYYSFYILIVVGVFKGVHTLASYYFVWETIPIVNNFCIEKIWSLSISVSEFRQLKAGVWSVLS